MLLASDSRSSPVRILALVLRPRRGAGHGSESGSRQLSFCSSDVENVLGEQCLRTLLPIPFKSFEVYRGTKHRMLSTNVEREELRA